MEVLSLSELKSLCQQRKLPVSGKKSELIERLTKASSASSSSSAAAAARGSASANASSVASSSGPPTAASASSAPFPSDYEGLTIPQLKDLCRERLLPVGGIKDDLVARLSASDPRNMRLAQLKDRCRDAVLPVTGTKADLVDRVMKSMSSGTAALLQAKSVDELKDLCRGKGVAVAGKKDDLIDRIKQASVFKSKAPDAAVSMKASQLTSSTHTVALINTKKKMVEAPAYEVMTIPQLKDLCREKKLMVGGTKDELVDRLTKAAASAISTMKSSRPSPASAKTSSASTSSMAAATVVPSASADGGYESIMVPQLKDLCRSRTLPVMGTKEELVKRLKEHDDVVRAMFKKRKSLSASSVTSSTSSVTAKRPLSSAELKTKKIKISAPQLARKSAPRKQQPTGLGRYIVYSTLAYPRDGFHSYDGPGVPTYYESYATKEEANDRVNSLFYKENPWGLGSDEMDDTLDIDENWDGGLLRLEVCPEDSQQWVVGVKDRATLKREDDDVTMVSGSDTEDEYAY